MGEIHKADEVDFVGNAFSVLGTSTGATGAQDANIDYVGDVSAQEDADAALMPDIDASRIRAVFFDLDGTLLPMDLDEFLKKYFGEIGRFVAARGLDAQAFSDGFSLGLKKMGHHGPELTNCEAFWEEFFTHANAGEADWQSALEEFYTVEFPKIGKDIVANPDALRVVEAFVRKGYPVVLATMPYFPFPAVQARLSWSGVPEQLFTRLTHYENSCAAKPSTYYYAENLAACGLHGEDVLMVGNNTVEDLSFSELGAHVFITTDWLINPNGMSMANVAHGTLAQFADWVDTLPACQNPATDIDPGRIARELSERAYSENAKTEER